MPLRGLRWLLAVLLALGTTALGLGSPARAAADEPVPLVRITLKSFAPAVLQPGSTVTITGTVTNISGRPLAALSAYTWRSALPITTGAGLEAAATSVSNDPIGERISEFGRYDVLLDGSRTLADKASLPFTLRTSTKELLGDNPANGVYLMGVQVLQPSSNLAIGRARIYVPVVNPSQSTGTASTVKLSSLVMLDTTPSLVRTGVLSSDRLATEVRTGGRLDRLLRSAERPDISYAVDPDLIATLRTMSAGYQVLGSDGRLVAGSGRTAAQDWLRRFALVQADHDGFRLPWARYDLPSLVHADRLGVAQAAETAAKAVDAVGDLPLLIAPAGGYADQATLDAARTLGARAVLLDSAGVGGLGPLLRRPDGLTVLTYDSTSSSGGPGPAPDTTAVHLRQSALAASYIQALTADPGVTVGQLRVVSDPDQAAGDLNPSTAPWLRISSVGDLLAGNPTTWTGRPDYPANARRAELTPAELTATDDLGTDYATLSQLLADPAGLSTQRDQALPRVVSDTWRGQAGDQEEFVEQQAAPFDQVLRGDLIRLEARDLVLTGSAGNVPLTVVNGYSQPIRVQVTFTSPNRQRLSVADVPADKVGVVAADDRIPITAEVEARAPGALPVQARLTTVDGTPIGKVVTIQINPTQASRIGWLISVLALVVLVGSTAFRIRQVRRERARQEPAGGATGG